MIVVDTSALVAIYRREPEARRLFETIATASDRILPAPCFLEFMMLRRYGGNRRAWLAFFIESMNLRIVGFSAEMAEIAADAAERYGRGSGHKAQLNFGDCLSYAIARHMNAPLLYVGGDFAHTDIESALQ